MQFSTSLLVSALSIGSTFAQSGTVSGTASTSTSTSTSGSITVHVVKVGSANGSLTYSPNNVVAAKGDMVQFQFAPANHTVTQSTFDQPCQPISLNTNTTGFYSGFMPVSAASTTVPTYTIMVNATTPIWVYCSQGKHCQAGMTMVINENTSANATRSLANFQALAKVATANLPGDATAASLASSAGSASSAVSSAGSATSGTASADGTLANSATASSASSTSSTVVQASSAANANAKVVGMSGVFGLLAAMLL